MARITVDFWALDIRLELSWLRSYLDVLERHLSELPGNPPESIRADLQHPDEDVWQPMQQEWSALSEEAAPRLARGAYIVALHAAYEAGVAELAEKVRGRTGADLRLEDISGNTFLEQAKKYFDKVLRIPLCPSPGHWSVLGELAIVRHAFAHSNGRIASLGVRGRRVFEAMQQRGDARESWGAILIEARYARRALQIVDATLRDLAERTKPPRNRATSQAAHRASPSPQ
jgi:hypothetical protein